MAAGIDSRRRPRGCIVSPDQTLVSSVGNHDKRNRVDVFASLAELPDKAIYDTCLIDTKAPDIDLWPAHKLLWGSLRPTLWMFTISSYQDMRMLAPFLPEGSLVFQDGPEVTDRVISRLLTSLDTEAWKKIESVEFIERVRAFVVHMFSGKIYLMELADINEADNTHIDSVEIEEGHYFFQAIQSSGHTFQVPWDVVLHYCEPEYAYYKGKQAPESDGKSAGRIGRRVRELRIAGGLTISELAEQATMKRPNLSRLEHGKHLPSLQTLERVADALGVSVASIVARDVSPADVSAWPTALEPIHDSSQKGG